MIRWTVVLGFLAVCACGTDPVVSDAAPAKDALAGDASVVLIDANEAVADAAVVVDAAVIDAAVPDATVPDAAVPDAAVPDAMIPMSLFACSVRDENLYQLNPATGAQVTSVAMTAGMTPLNNCYGMAAHPTTYTLYVLMSANNTGGPKQMRGRTLFTVNTSTGVLTEIGNTTENLVGLAFASDGTLYGASGNNATVQNNLYSINTATGALTSVVSLGVTSHHALAFNPNDGLLYHFYDGVTAAPQLATVNISTMAISPITTTGATTNQVGAALWSPDAGVFLLTSSRETAVYSATTSGVVTALGTAPARIKGLAFAPTP